MTRKLLGYFMVSLPFIVLAHFIYRMDGIQAVLFVYGLAGAIVGLIVGGVFLLKE